MNKFINILFLFLIFIFQGLRSQEQKKDNLPILDSKFDISVGMGIKAISASDIVKYVNSFTGVERERNISVAPEFSISPEYQISDDLSLKLDYTYILKSYDKTTSYTKLSISYAIHSPTLVLQYLLKGGGYFLKMGGGLGYHFGSLSQEFGTGNKSTYYANGIGLKIDLAGHTMLSGNLFAVIGVNLQADFMGELKNRDNEVITSRQKISLGFLGAGLDFGLAYYF
jgi:hypothetical protein